MRIYHISDIHITKKKYKTLLKYFIELKIIIQNDKDPNKVLVIAGDIFSTRTYISNEDSQFYNKIISLLNNAGITTILISGTYDIYNGASHLTSSKEKNIIVLNQTTSITINDINFYSFSIIDREIPTLKEGFNVAIMHEFIITDPLFIDANSIKAPLLKRFTQNLIEDYYDFVLLGGLHKHHKISPKMAYSGSLIQDTSQDSSTEYGYVLWDTTIKTMQFCPLQTQDLELTIFAQNNKELQLPDVETKSIILRYLNCTETFINRLNTQLFYKYNQYPNITINEDYLLKMNPQGYVISHSEYISQALNERCSEEELEQVLELHNHNIQKLDATLKPWKLKFLFWDNIFKYQNKNYINFSEVDGLIAINGPNGAGKSSIIDILLYILYNFNCRTTKYGLINKNCNKAKIICFIDIDSTSYKIERVITKTTSNCTLQRDGKQIKKGPNEVYSFLETQIGKADQFKVLNIGLQDRQLIPDLSSKERRKIILQLLHLEWIDQRESFKDLFDQKEELISKIKELSKNYKFNITYQNLCEVIKQMDTLENKEKREQILANLNTCLSTYIKLQEILEYLKVPQRIFNLYDDCLSHNSIIKPMFDSLTSILDIYCNNILSLVSEFRIKFITSNKSFDIHLIFNEQEINITAASGYQKFLIDLVLRIVLVNMMNLPNNIIILDEGFGCIDSNHLDHVFKLLLILKKKYKNIFIITHLEELESYADYVLKIESNSLKSSLMYGTCIGY